MLISTAFAEISTIDLIAALALLVGVYFLINTLSLALLPPRKRRETNDEAVEDAASVKPKDSSVDKIGNITLEELRAYDGSDPEKPLLIAIRGNIYDVSRSRVHYGHGCPYSNFTGRETSRALALMSFDENDFTDNIDGLSKADLEVLDDWEQRFMDKYVIVGKVIPGGCSEKIES